MIYINIGRRERGKTTLAYGMVRKIRKRVILDPRRMIQRQDTDYAYSSRQLAAILPEMMEEPSLNEVVYQPTEDDLRDAFAAFSNQIKATVIKHPRASIAILVDEASFYDLDLPSFQWLAKCTKRELVHIVITGHRPSDIPTSIRAIADHWFLFATRQEHDLKVIEQRSGSPRVAQAVAKLREREFVHWNDAIGTMTINNRPSDWFVSMQQGVIQTERIVVDEPTEKDFELESE